MVKLVKVQALHPEPSWGVVTETHAWHELVLMAFGRYVLTGDGRTMAASAGDLFVMPAGLEHTRRVFPRTKTRLYIVQWHGDWPAIEPRLHHLHDRHGRALPLVEWLCEQWRTGAARRRLNILTQALFLLLEDLAGFEPQRMSDKIHEIMVSELHVPYATDELARAVCMSRYHFCRRFKAETGQSPIQYFQRLRAERAVSLIRNTELPMYEIARTVGFETPSHLTRIVRKHTGKTPTALRQESIG